MAQTVWGNEHPSNRLPDSESKLTGRAIWIRGQLQLIDMNSDGLADILRLSGDGNEWTASLFLNQSGSLISLRPIRSCASQVTT